jgi:hypothetical protein
MRRQRKSTRRVSSVGTNDGTDTDNHTSNDADSNEEPPAKKCKYSENYEPIDTTKAGIYAVQTYGRDDYEPFTAFRWKIEMDDDSEEEIYSPEFTYGGKKWKLLLYPRGNRKAESNNCLSIYLGVADRTKFTQSNWTRECRFSFHILNQNNLADTYARKIRKTTTINQSNCDWGFHSFIPIDEFNDPAKGYKVNGKTFIEIRLYHNLNSDDASRLEGIDREMVVDITSKLFYYSLALTKDGKQSLPDQWVNIECLDGYSVYSFLPLLAIRYPLLMGMLDSEKHTINIPLSAYSTIVLLAYLICDKLPSSNLEIESNSAQGISEFLSSYSDKYKKTQKDIISQIVEEEANGVETKVANGTMSSEEKLMDILNLYLYLSKNQGCERLRIHLLNCIESNLSPSNVIQVLSTAYNSEQNDGTKQLLNHIGPYLTKIIYEKKLKEQIKDLNQLKDPKYHLLFFDIIVNLSFEVPNIPAELPPSNFIECMQTLFDSSCERNTDVKLYLDENHECVIFAHKILLSLCCPFLKNLFEKDQRSEVNLYEIEDFSEFSSAMSPEDLTQRKLLLRQLIEYFYAGKYCVTLENAFTLLSFCSYFGFVERGQLIESCVHIIVKNLTVDNIFIIIGKFANVKDLHVMKEMCINFCANNWKEITEKYSEQELCEFVDAKFWYDLTQFLFNHCYPFQ